MKEKSRPAAHSFAPGSDRRPQRVFTSGADQLLEAEFERLMKLFTRVV